MRILWWLVVVVSGFLTVAVGISALTNALSLRLYAISNALVCTGLFFLTRWAWRKAKARPGRDGDDRWPGRDGDDPSGTG
jgi:formate hydrogenlyase subunit 3/multisubunit Na+/H+ antiporter MnhD subunit